MPLELPFMWEPTPGLPNWSVLERFNVPTWVRARWSVPQVPMGRHPGGTQPIVPDPAPVQIPTVVPRRQPDFTNTQPPPIIPIGIPPIRPGGVAQDDFEGEEKVALSDWIQGGLDVAETWIAGQAAGGWGAQPAQLVAPSAAPPMYSTTAVSNGTPSGMYVDKHGHLVHRRRRRRPCISQTDLNLAYQVAQLPNNANVRMFLAKCVH